ncbi:P-type conjugative transfer protein TrbG [Caulobacter flavus]|uniref:P-type conjugative transfer protein TrbG n=1 Tax=Caulobacter flavus TaxID=1679497 RepID=A0A2N5CP93_9CAUL|nr:P-type conjugative transfer protein TrbG [Caulobacter flavus]AYV48518.1 P-type conjugative transfer protein TrbG [Caulobacter flavus]PLR08767.1 P-type conjugative transfer protein TrbG [Caulobacter flavus]
MTRLVLALAVMAMASAAHAARPAAEPQSSPPVEYPFDPAGIYPLVAAPGRITDIVLEPGEALAANNPIAAGDTARWIIGDTASGEGEGRRVHVLVKPTAANLSTNLVINTDRRTYLIDVRASSRGFLSQVRWRYPKPPAAPRAAATLVAASSIAPSPAVPVVLNYGYRISGWARLRPERVWDDGKAIFIAFRPAVSMADLPPLFAVGADGKTSELVNYRVEGRVLIVDRLAERLELRLGLRELARRVRIERLPSKEAAR